MHTRKKVFAAAVALCCGYAAHADDPNTSQAAGGSAAGAELVDAEVQATSAAFAGDNVAQGTEPDAQVTAASSIEKDGSAAAAKERGLVPNDYDPEKSVRICREEIVKTGSRLPRKRCKSAQQWRKEAAARHDDLSRNSSRIPRTPPNLGGRSKKD